MTPATLRGISCSSCLHAVVNLVVDRLRLARVRARADDEVVRVRAHGPHVEDRRVGRQLFLGDPGDPLGVVERRQRAAGFEGNIYLEGSSIETELVDELRDRFGDEVVDAARRGRRARGCRADDDRERVELELDDPVGAGQALLGGVDALAVGAGPGRDGETDVRRGSRAAPASRGSRRTRPRRRRRGRRRSARSPSARCRPCTKGLRGRARGARARRPGCPRTRPRRGGTASRRRCRPACAAPRRRRPRSAGRGRAPRSPARASATCPLCGGSNVPPRSPTGMAVPAMSSGP